MNNVNEEVRVEAYFYQGYTRCPHCGKPLFSEQLQGVGGTEECTWCHKPIRPEFLEWR